MNALFKTSNSFRTGMLCGSCLFRKLTPPMTEILLCKRNYKLPVAVYEGEMKLKKNDNVPLDSEIIYRVSVPKRIRAWVFVANVKLMGVPVVLGIIYNERHGKFSFHNDYALDLMSQSLIFLTETQCYCIGSMCVVLSFMLNRFACLHPLRIYLENNSNKFIAIYMDSFLPWRLHKHEFTTVKPSFKTVLLNKRRAIIHEDYFRTQADQYKLCPYLMDDHPV